MTRWLAALSLTCLIDLMLSLTMTAAWITTALWLAGPNGGWLIPAGLLLFFWGWVAMAIDSLFDVGEFSRDLAFNRFGFEARKPSMLDAEVSDSRIHRIAFGLYLAQASLVILPLFVLVELWSGQDMDGLPSLLSITMVVLLLVFILGFGGSAYRRVRWEYYGDEIEPDDPDTPDHQRERWRSVFNQDRDGKS